jgi:hypothetical protein
LTSDYFPASLAGMISKLKKVLPFVIAINFMVAINFILLDNAKAQIRKSLHEQAVKIALASNELKKSNDQIQ